MHSKAIFLSVLAAVVEARSFSEHTLEDNTANNLSFGQEQISNPAIQAVTSGGAPGVADTLAGSAISTLLATANLCAKVQHIYANESDTTLTTHSFKSRRDYRPTWHGS
jgi:hypothetical protein